MNWTGLLFAALCSVPFAAIAFGGLLLIRSSSHTDGFIVLLKPWRETLSRFIDVAYMPTIDRVAVWVIGSILVVFGTSSVVVLATVAVIWSKG